MQGFWKMSINEQNFLSVMNAAGFPVGMWLHPKHTLGRCMSCVTVDDIADAIKVLKGSAVKYVWVMFMDAYKVYPTPGV